MVFVVIVVGSLIYSSFNYILLLYLYHQKKLC